MDHIADFFNQIDKQLEMPVERRVEVMREMLLHYRDIVDDLMSSGIEESQAQLEAMSRLGPSEEIAARLNVVHNSAPLKSALLCAVPFLGWAICLMMPTRFAMFICGSLLGAMLIIGSARELLRGRRPVWLATWLAISYVGVWYILDMPHDSPAFPIFLALSVVLVVWNSPGWRRRVIGFALLGVVCVIVSKIIEPAHGVRLEPIVRLALMASAMGLLVSVIGSLYNLAMSLFADPRSGSPWRASLFLFAICVCSTMQTHVRFDARIMAMSFVTAGLAVIIFVTASQWRIKAAALSVGILAKLALFDAFVNHGYNSLTGAPDLTAQEYLTGLIILWAIFSLFALTPMLSERADREGRRAAARS